LDKVQVKHVHVIQKVSSKLTLILQNDSDCMPLVNYPGQHMCSIYCGSMLSSEYEVESSHTLSYGSSYISCT